MGQYLANLKASGTDSEKDAQFEHNAAQAALQLESSLLATQQAVASAKRELQQAKSEYPLPVDRIVDLTNKVEDYEKGLTIIGGLKTELFS